MSKKDPLLFDVRAIERNLRHGAINHADVQKYLDSLPDVSSKAVTLGEIEDVRAEAAAQFAARSHAAEAAAPAPELERSYPEVPAIAPAPIAEPTPESPPALTRDPYDPR